jgi:sulfur-oxidizing protein SoxZ
MSRAVVTVPARARKGEVIPIRTLVQHAMETGFRRTQEGKPIARSIITRFACTYDGAEVFAIDLHPAIAANPLISFHTVATASGTLTFEWTGDAGFSLQATAQIEVT